MAQGKLGFGFMRLPVFDGNPENIDFEQLNQMVDEFIGNGFTFLESYDFSGKTICPLITHGGSGFSNSLSDIRRLCPDARITEGLAINGDDVQDCDLVVEKWLNKIGLK